MPQSLSLPKDHQIRPAFGSTAARQHGSTEPWRDRMFDFDALNAAIGTPGMLAQGKQYD